MSHMPSRPVDKSAPLGMQNRAPRDLFLPPPRNAVPRFGPAGFRTRMDLQATGRLAGPGRREGVDTGQ